jgi:prolyl-tRNA editing enzyme YbaK/EbsC (Cys-tRNA(Pro) deacylase)
VVASGRNRVDEKKVGALLGRKVARADADFVLLHTGFAPGGVAPVGHLTPPVTLLDVDLRACVKLWASAGSANAVFELTPDDLARLTGAAFVEVAKRG